MKSMTGYGRAEGSVAQTQVTVEVRCYNHRFKDIRMRLPRGWLALEVRAEGLIKGWLERGRVECHVRSATGVANLGRPTLDMAAALEYFELYRKLADEIEKSSGAKETPTLNLIARSEGVVAYGDVLGDVEEAWSEMKTLLTKALQGAELMRSTEGSELYKVIQKHLAEADSLREKIEVLVPQESEVLAQRAQQRIRAAADQVEIAPERLIQELAVLSERMDVTEELARLGSHMMQYREVMQRNEPIGRELDFLLQEMNREANTLSSKMHSAPVVSLAVALKAEIEKIREQIQNVE